MKKDELQVITLNPDRTMKKMRLPIIYEDDSYCVSYLGDNYEIHLEKVFLDDRRPTIVLNPFLVGMVHELTQEQWRDKLKDKEVRVYGNKKN